jgi:hypothetical protein
MSPEVLSAAAPSAPTWMLVALGVLAVIVLLGSVQVAHLAWRGAGLGWRVARTTLRLARVWRARRRRRERSRLKASAATLGPALNEPPPSPAASEQSARQEAFDAIDDLLRRANAKRRWATRQPPAGAAAAEDSGAKVIQLSAYRRGPN